METITALTGSAGAVLLPYRGRLPLITHLPVIPHSQSLAPALEAYVRDGWSGRDERHKPFSAFEKRGVVSEFDFTTPDEIAGSPYYQEFLAPFGLRWFAGVKIACGGDVWCLSMQRSIEQGPFSKDHLRKFIQLSGQLSASAGLSQMLGFAKANAALEAFQVSGVAAVLIDRHGSVFRLNAAAEQLLGLELQIRNGQLVWSDHRATTLLNSSLHQLLWGGMASGPAAPVVLPREHGRPVVAYPTQLTTLAQDILAPARAAVVFVDLARQTATSDHILRSVFGLSPAEARLAMRISSGESLEFAADALGVAYETARNHLKAVFAKTDTHRQAEVVSLLARLLTGFPHR